MSRAAPGPRQAGQDRARAHRVVDPLARAPAQRSLCQAGQGRRLSQPRRLQADRARREVRPAQGRAARGRPRRRARRLEPGRAQAARPRRRSSASTCCQTEPIEGVTLLQMDFMADEAPAALEARWAARPIWCCRTWPPTPSATSRPTTCARWAWSRPPPSSPSRPAPGGAFVAKVFAGGTDAECWRCSRATSARVKHAKPPASRKGSSEWYVIAQGFKGRGMSPRGRY